MPEYQVISASYIVDKSQRLDRVAILKHFHNPYIVKNDFLIFQIYVHI